MIIDLAEPRLIFRRLMMCVCGAVTKRRHKLLAEVLSDVCWWKAASPFPRRLLWDRSLKVSFLSFLPLALNTHLAML